MISKPSNKDWEINIGGWVSWKAMREEGWEFVQFNLRVQDTEVVEIVGRKLMM